MDAAIKLKEAMGALVELLQRNADALYSQMEKRESVYWASANIKDIEDRYLRTVTIAADKGREALQEKLSTLANGETPNLGTINLFTKRIRVDDLDIRVFDENVFAFFLFDVLKGRTSDIANMFVRPDAGLELTERKAALLEFDNKINELEQEQRDLYSQAQDAGLTVTERVVER